jgi:ABC-type lipoprotein release transport system permease subunit
VGEGLARDMHVRVGRTLVLMGQAADGSIASGLFRVNAIVPVAVDQVNQTGILMNLAAAGEFMAMEDRAHELVIRARDAEAIPGVAAAVRDLPGVAGLEVATWDQLAPQMAAMIRMIGSMNGIIIVLVFITTVAGVANTMLMATFERSHEFGMLLALGVKPGRLVRMLFLEAVALGLAGVVIGSVLGVALAWPGIRHGIDLGGLGFGGVSSVSVGGVSISRFVLILRVRDILIGVAAVLVTSVLATIWPARRLSRLEPVEALRA